MHRQWIYYPSFSVGSFASGLKKDLEVIDGVPYRFYNSKMPTDYHHPYFLMTAGHNYKNEYIREEWGLDEEGITVLGDSGGYQIATGVLDWSDDLKEHIFRWLENNSDIAMNLDIPTGYRLGNRKQFNTFDECLEVSYDNFKYFNEKQSGKTQFLNVLQGDKERSITRWYNKVKDFDFSGWALGQAAHLDQLMLKMAFLVEQGELEKKKNKYIHVLGISKISDFFILSYLQRVLNEMYDGRIQMSTDSSTPVRTAAFGHYLLAPNYKRGRFANLVFSNKDDGYEPDIKLPCTCIVCDNSTYEDIQIFNSRSYGIISFHNIFQFINTMEVSERIVDSHDALIQQSVSSEFFDVLKSIPDILYSPHPVRRFTHYLQLYNKFVNINRISAGNSLENFFVSEE